MKRLAPVLLGLALSAAGGAAQAALRITTWTTAEGARVLFVPAPEIPMVDVRVVFAAGAARDGTQPGLAGFVNSLLSDGAGERDADAFSIALGQTGAVLGNGAQRDMAYVRLRTLAEAQYADPALALLTDAVARQRFDDRALERARARAVISLEQKQQSAESIAEDRFYSEVYRGHPYASPPDGTQASITALTRADVRAFHRRYYVARNAVIAIVGALDEQAARAWSARISAPLPAGTPAPAQPEVGPTKGAAHRVALPAIQSHIQIGLPGISRDDADYFALLLGNHVLGGSSLNSLLSREIRSKRGLTYGVSSYFTPMAEAGPFIAMLKTDASQEAEALEVLHDTLEAFVADGPPAAELEAARQNLIGGFPLRLASNRQIVEYVAMIGFYALPLDYLDTYTKKVAAVTSAEVRDAFRRRIVPDSMITVIVGPPAAVSR